MTHLTGWLAEESDFLREGFLAFGPRRDLGAGTSSASSSILMRGVPVGSVGVDAGSIEDVDGSVASGVSVGRFLLPLPGPPLWACNGGPGEEDMFVTWRINPNISAMTALK